VRRTALRVAALYASTIPNPYTDTLRQKFPAVPRDQASVVVVRSGTTMLLPK
jgi:hypothetical protein